MPIIPYGYTLDDYEWENQIDQHDQENGVLKNHYHFSDLKNLNEVERDFSQQSQFEILDDGSNPVFSSEYYCSIHRRLFCDIYPWAGEFRTVDFTKGDSIFVPVQHIEKLLNESLIRLYCDLKTNQNPEPELFANAIGRFVADVNTIHPFREGNGRTQRIFSQKTAHKHGYHLNYNSVSSERMKQACIAAFDSNYEPMQKIMKNIIGSKPSELLTVIDDKHLVEDNNFSSITYHPPGWNEKQKIAPGTVKGVSEKYVLMKNETGFSVYRRLDLTRNYTVGQEIGDNGEFLNKVSENSAHEINSLTAIPSRTLNRKKP